jgi:hypothetical protein
MESSSLESQATQQRHQNVVVMRHGDRMDNFEPLWVTTAARPWDPPLVEAGLVRAFCTGRKIRNQLGFPIHRVFVSPFLRCVQTASQVVSALCALHDDPNNLTADNVAIDPSKIKVFSAFSYSSYINYIYTYMYIFFHLIMGIGTFSLLRFLFGLSESLIM